eukprot:CAMPEP_0172407776 /NCGR_PEP_ID=MMETSP1061-20121228/75512_1 /TAXON_ID=37318 /ORGANISM="Pseudo-nitzschia pungens, Strain cf. pungens" /LENGTH=104 /DNA_ID=CAMNT_0013143883 /DNA_START=453 /DNA_END=767 /DNA_ORIENTATION=+
MAYLSPSGPSWYSCAALATRVSSERIEDVVATVAIFEMRINASRRLPLHVDRDVTAQILKWRTNKEIADAPKAILRDTIVFESFQPEFLEVLVDKSTAVRITGV